MQTEGAQAVQLGRQPGGCATSRKSSATRLCNLGESCAVLAAMSLHDRSVFQMSKMLRNLEAWLDKSVAFAESRSFDPENFLGERLAPDQFSLRKQVQASCDAAKAAAARLAGIEPPSHADTETTLLEVRQRIHKTLAFLETVTPDKLEGREDVEVKLPFLEGKGLKASDYLMEMALPNFYFHITTAYAILRHSGVELGKRAYIGSLRVYDL